MSSTAISVEAASAQASAIVSAAPVSLSGLIVITPSNPQLAVGASQQFTASIVGTSDTQVSWHATYGTITSSGLYTATGNQSPDTIQATSAHANGSTMVQIAGLKPALTAIAPQPATAGDSITVTGTNLNGWITGVFSNAAGGTISTLSASGTGTSAVLTVPQGSVSGPFYVLAQQSGFAAVQSNSIQFQRLARLRIHPPANDVAAGESLVFGYAFLGDATPRTVTFSADVGSFVGATYTAPTVLNADTFAHVTACITGTQSCDSYILGLHPFRIAPAVPLVGAGQSLQLSALMGAGGISATWNLLAGGGSLNSAGLYQAGTQLQDGGPALISAVSSGVSEQTSTGVTGLFPGLVNRTAEYADQHDPNQLGRFLVGLAVNGNRLYAATSNHLGAYNNSYFWIDVFDISNPAQPVWLTAVESNSNGSLAQVGQYLYSWANADLAVPGFPNTITLYSISTGIPVLVSQVQVPLWWDLQQSQGIITLIPLSGNAPPGFVEDQLYDLTAGAIALTDLEVPLPANAGSFLPDSSIAVGSRLFISTVEDDGSTGELLTYDRSVSPPNLLGSIGGRSLAFSSSGNWLFGALGGMDVYDISSQLPQLQSHVNGINALQLSGNQLLALTSQQGWQQLDFSNPQNPKITTILFDGVSQGCGWGALVGTYMYGCELDGGGVAVFDASKPGGPIPKTTLYGGGTFSTVTLDMLPQPPYLYAATATDLGATLSVYDISTSPATLAAQYLDQTQQAVAVQSSANYLYLGMTNTLAVLDVSNPTAPSLVTSLSLPTASLARTNNTLYAGTFSNTLAVLNISSPGLPAILSTLTLPDLPLRLRVSGNHMFVADNFAGLLIFDISVPTAPVLVSQFAGLAQADDVLVQGTTAYVAADVDGLALLDVSNPANPVLLSKTQLNRTDPFLNFDPLSEGLSLAINNGIVYVGTLNDNGLVLGFDVTRPAAPRLVSVYAYSGGLMASVYSLTFEGTDLFVGGSLDGTYSVAQADMSQPFDSINTYFPPAALQSPALPGTLHAQPKTPRKSQPLVVNSRRQARFDSTAKPVTPPALHSAGQQ